MAPYVEMEWGTKAYEIMWRLKELFDPEYVLNPGVVLNKVSCSLLTGVWEIYITDGLQCRYSNAATPLFPG